MQRVDLFNGLLLALGVSTSLVAMVHQTPPAPPFTAGRAVATHGAIEVRLESSEHGPALRDATGALVPVGPYRRIVSASTIADALLVELVEPSRVAAYTDYSTAKEWDAHRFADKPKIPGLGRLEAILALEPDLVLVSALDDRSKATRLRDAGLTVFDLGPMQGWGTLRPTIATLGALLDVSERASRYAAALERRRAVIAEDIAPEHRRRAMYLSVYGLQLYGGAARTSFHDVLTSAGLHDIAAETYSGWPLMSPEQVLALEPELIVTNERMAETLCRNPGLERLAACKTPRGVVTLPEWLLGDPGPNMVVAAELLREAVYGKRGRP